MRRRAARRRAVAGARAPRRPPRRGGAGGGDDVYIVDNAFVRDVQRPTVTDRAGPRGDLALALTPVAQRQRALGPERFAAGATRNGGDFSTGSRAPAPTGSCARCTRRG